MRKLSVFWKEFLSAVEVFFALLFVLFVFPAVLIAYYLVGVVWALAAWFFWELPASCFGVIKKRLWASA
jgi:hypothetical protein